MMIHDVVCVSSEEEEGVEVRDRKQACILTVPEALMLDSKNFYYPQMVSVGPYHHCRPKKSQNIKVSSRTSNNPATSGVKENEVSATKENEVGKDVILPIEEVLAFGDMERKSRLLRMENDKGVASKRFWEREAKGRDIERSELKEKVYGSIGDNANKKVAGNNADKKVAGNNADKKVADCYDRDILPLWDRSLFQKMVLRDAAFLMEFINYYVRGLPQHDEEQNSHGHKPGWSADSEEENDPIFYERSNNLVLYAILMDIMKLENQIPMFVLEKVATYVKKIDDLKELVRRLSVHVSPINSHDQKPASDKILQSKHLLDCFRLTVDCPVEGGPEREEPRRGAGYFIFWVIRGLHKLFSRQRRDDVIETMEKRFLSGGARKLQKAGVTFVAMKKGGIKEIEFDPNKCILWLPRIDVGIWTETLLRNLVAYEACITDSKSNDKPINRFVLFMSQLLDGEKSAELLKESEIILNNLGDDKRLLKMWNDISISRWIPESEKFDVVTRELNYHLSCDWIGMFFEFWETYFSKPWLVLTVIVAFITLVASVLGVWNPFDKKG